jgi:hypothetical protein
VVNGDPWDDDGDGVPDEEEDDGRARADAEVADVAAAFEALIPLAPGDALLARPAVEAVARAMHDARGPDDPTPGMMSVPALIEDALTRAQLADASPGAREPLGDLERMLLVLPTAVRTAAAERIRAAVRAADSRLRDDPGRRPGSSAG